MTKMIAATLLVLCSCGSRGSEAHSQEVQGPRPKQQELLVKRPLSNADLTRPAVRIQLARHQFDRDGKWQPAMSVTTPVLVSRDGRTSGARILVLRPSSGYDVYLADLDCEGHGAVDIGAGSGAVSDDAAPSARSQAPAYLDLSSEVRRICAQRDDPGRLMTIAGAAQLLRAGSARIAAPSGSVMPRLPDGGPSAADHAAARAAMDAYRASHPKR